MHTLAPHSLRDLATQDHIAVRIFGERNNQTSQSIASEFISQQIFERRAQSGGINLANNVTGILQSANGGTGSAYFTAAGATAERIYTFPDAAATILYSGGDAGTPSALVGTNISGTAASLTAGTASAVAVGGITGLGTGVSGALVVNVGSAGAFVAFNGALGTPSSGTVTNLTGTASININGTVGGTTAAAGAFTTAQSTTPVNSLTAGIAQYKSGTWTPSAHIATTTGTPTYAGSYTRIGNRVFCTLIIAGAGTTTIVKNSDYFDGLPYAPSEDNVVNAVLAGTNDAGHGYVYTGGGGQVYPPAWSATASVVVEFSYITTANF